MMSFCEIINKQRRKYWKVYWLFSLKKIIKSNFNFALPKGVARWIKFLLKSICIFFLKLVSNYQKRRLKLWWNLVSCVFHLVQTSVDSQETFDISHSSSITRWKSLSLSAWLKFREIKALLKVRSNTPLRAGLNIHEQFTGSANMAERFQCLRNSRPDISSL